MTDIDDFAEALLRAHRSGRRTDASALVSPDYRQALAIQRHVQAALGPVGGFKVARRPEGPPVIAPIVAERMVLSGAEVAVRDVMGIELEIGFEAMTDPVSGMMDAPQRHFRPRVVLELVDTRLIGAEGDPMMKLADMQINAGLVIGPALDGWDGSDFSTVTAALRCGAEGVIGGPVDIPGGSALAALGLFIDHLGDHCGGLRAGHIVITGSVSPLAYYPGKTAVSAKIEGIGAIDCRLKRAETHRLRPRG
jgi:2-keto-4-pentenoate hydratase